MHGNNKRKRYGANKSQGGLKPGENRPTWIKDLKEERHAGSYPLDDVKASALYERRVTQPEHSVKRKYAVCVSYLGTDYQGLQINPGAKTIEGELERALFLAGAIIEQNYGFMQKIQWTRAARTDRGVHALTQCCAMKLLFPEKERALFIEQVNSFLPDEIRVQCLTKVSKNFNAKGMCTKRRYQYLLPTFALQNINDVNKVLADAFNNQGPVKGAGYEGGYVDPNTAKTLTKESLALLRNEFVQYRVNSNVVESFRTALHAYEGTKNYHNFTSGKDSTEANSKRYILSFTCGEPFVCDTTGVEYVLLSVLGQSFLLNQIRKMVHFALEICRGGATFEKLDIAFSEAKVEIPMAPALGLYLDELFFEGYNIKMRFETENDKRVIQKKLDEAAAAEIQNINEDAESKPVEDNNDDELLSSKKQKIEECEPEDNADDAEQGSREDIDWYGSEETKAKINHFRQNKLHPHVMQEEESSLVYMYYLDYCRAFSHSYMPHKSKESNNVEIAHC